MFAHRYRTLRRLGAAPLHAVSGAVLLSCFVVLAPQAVPAPDRAVAPFSDAGTVTLATGGTAADLDPASMVVAAANVLETRNMAETLVDYNGSRVDQFVPLLATSWRANADKS